MLNRHDLRVIAFRSVIYRCRTIFVLVLSVPSSDITQTRELTLKNDAPLSWL